MVDSKQHSRFSPEVDPKLGAKIMKKLKVESLKVKKKFKSMNVKRLKDFTSF